MPAIRPLSPELQDAARQELGEEPARTEKDLQAIKEWLNKQPHLIARTDDQFLLGFLRGCKFSLERTKEKLDFYYTIRTALPEIFLQRDPMLPEMQGFLDLGLALPLPGTDAEGRRVIILRVGAYDPAKVDAVSVVMLNYLFTDLMIQDDDTAMVKGMVHVIDLTGYTLAHALQFPPALIKKTMMCYQDAYPVRQQGLHYFRVPSFFETILNIIKSCLKEKIRKRIFVHGDLDSLCKDIPKKILPKEYGGEGPSVKELTATWKKKVESYRDFLLEDEKFVANEKRRPGRPKTQADLFGVEGSFRQLTVD